MEDGRRKIWICILTVVLAAVIIGLVYYLGRPQEYSQEGFLIRGKDMAVEWEQRG